MVLLMAAGRSPDWGIFVLFGAIALGAIGYQVYWNTRRRNNLAAAAAEFQGSVVASFWKGHRLEFQVEGIPGELTYHEGGRSNSTYTRVRFQFVPPGQLRVIPEGLFTSLRKAFGAQDIEFGDPGFDRSFMIQGSPEKWIREVLDSDARRRLNHLSILGRSSWGWGGGRFVVEAGPSGVAVGLGRNLVDERDSLLTFLRESIAFFRKLRGPSSEGITILSAEEQAGRGNCPVCASPLDPSPRRCLTCGTPHHEDCWTYLGGCAIYGCSRRRTA